MRCGEYYAKGIMKFQKELGLYVNRVRHLGLYEIEDDAGETTELSNEITSTAAVITTPNADYSNCKLQQPSGWMKGIPSIIHL